MSTLKEEGCDDHNSLVDLLADISDPMASNSLGGPSKRAATMKAEVDDDHDEAMFQAAFPECPEIVTPKPVRRRTPGSPSPARTASGLQDDDGDEAKGESSTLMSEPAQSENATLQDRRLRMCVCVCPRESARIAPSPPRAIVRHMC